MKRHYYFEVALLLLLSVAAATLAADYHLYDLIWEYFHLDKSQFDNSVAFIRLCAFGAIIILSILNIWKHLHSEKKIVASLLAAVHKVFFSNVNLTDSSTDTIYRITCHKFYPYSPGRTYIGHAFCVLAIYLTGNSLTSNINSVSLTWLWILTLFFGFSFYFLFLYVIDSWWWQFWRRVFRRRWNRVLIPGRNYCLSYVRYGYEGGKLNILNTTIPFLVGHRSRASRLFTGKVYESNDEFEISKDHIGINSLIQKFNEERRKNPNRYNVDNASFRPLQKHPVSDSIEKLKELDSFKSSLSVEEQKKVLSFMENTNTLAYDLFDINKIRHCEHFLGFKIKGKNDSIWGVVVVDVLSNSDQSFYEYLGFETDEEWLKLFLASYSKLFSKAIIPSAND